MLAPDLHPPPPPHTHTIPILGKVFWLKIRESSYACQLKQIYQLTHNSDLFTWYKVLWDSFCLIQICHEIHPVYCSRQICLLRNDNLFCLHCNAVRSLQICLLPECYVTSNLFCLQCNAVLSALWYSSSFDIILSCLLVNQFVPLFGHFIRFEAGDLSIQMAYAFANQRVWRYSAYKLVTTYILLFGLIVTAVCPFVKPVHYLPCLINWFFVLSIIVLFLPADRFLGTGSSIMSSADAII